MERIYKVIQSDATILLSTMKIVYNFAILPSGGSCGTKCKEIESVTNKNSVVEIVNNDKTHNYDYDHHEALSTLVLGALLVSIGIFYFLIKYERK